MVEQVLRERKPGVVGNFVEFFFVFLDNERRKVLELFSKMSVNVSTMVNCTLGFHLGGGTVT